jgi:hypothetical protein
LRLHRRTFDRAVRTKYAAIARLRPQQRFALGAFIEKLAGIGRHICLLPVPAVRAGQYGCGDDLIHVVVSLFQIYGAFIILFDN